MKDRSKYWPQLVDILDSEFPKGEVKERGRAICMLAKIEMLLREEEKSPFEKSTPEELWECFCGNMINYTEHCNHLK